jgi:hypothetical protein
VTGASVGLFHLSETKILLLLLLLWRFDIYERISSVRTRGKQKRKTFDGKFMQLTGCPLGQIGGST